MYVRAGRPAFARPCVGIHKSTSLMSSSLLLYHLYIYIYMDVCIDMCLYVYVDKWIRGLVSLLNSKSTFVDYSKPKPSLLKNSSDII